MKALSLTRPWPFAFLSGPEADRKRIENRKWKPPAWIIGERIALHAAKSWDEDDRLFIENATGIEVPERRFHAHSEIFATCIVEDYVTAGQDLLGLRIPAEQMKWFFGPYGWLLSDVIELPVPVSCKGALGLWEISPDVLAEIYEQVREA